MNKTNKKISIACFAVMLALMILAAVLVVRKKRAQTPQTEENTEETEVEKTVRIPGIEEETGKSGIVFDAEMTLKGAQTEPKLLSLTVSRG